MQAHRLALVSFAFMVTLFQSQFDKELKEFTQYKSAISVITGKNHHHHLRTFKKQSKIQSCNEISADHIRSYSKHITDNHTPFVLMKHLESIRAFVRYYRHPYLRPEWITATGINENLLSEQTRSCTIKDMGTITRGHPEKVERNKELVLKRKEDPRKWSIRKLGAHYGISERAVWEIWHRDKDVY